MTKLQLPSARFTRTRTTWRKELVRRRWQVSRPIANALEGAKSQSFLVAVILTGHGLRACSEAVRPLSASQGLRCPFAWPLTPSVMAAQEKSPDLLRGLLAFRSGWRGPTCGNAALLA